MGRLSNAAKFAIIGIALLALAGIIMLIVAIVLGWDIIGGLTSPVAVVCYSAIAVAAISATAYFVKRKVSGE